VGVPYCADCERHFPGGKGLKGGRCPTCADLFKARRAEARKAAKPEREPKPEPESETEPEPEPEAEPAEGEREEE